MWWSVCNPQGRRISYCDYFVNQEFQGKCGMSLCEVRGWDQKCPKTLNSNPGPEGLQLLWMVVVVHHFICRGEWAREKVKLTGPIRRGDR